MEAETLAEDFKGQIAFMGGIDTQELLIHGSPAEVKEDVRRVKELLGPRLIVSPSHEAVLPDVLPENVEAMAEAAEGRTFHILDIIDEYSRECLAILVKRRITSQDVIEQLFELIIFRGIPEHIRSDNGPELTAKAIRRWLNRVGVKTLFIEPRSPWENGYIESFNGKLRDELLNWEIFTTSTQAKVLIG